MTPTFTINRRQMLQLAAMFGGTAALAACGGPSIGTGGGAVQSTSATDWKNVTPAKEITWWSNHPGASKPVEEELIKRFEKENPDIKVKLVTAGANYDEIAQKFQAASGTNNIPDLVIASDVWWFRYMINGQILPVDELAKQLEFDTEDFNTTLYDDYKFKDSHWAVPYARSTPLFYYNKSVWKEAGLPDRAPETWEEFDEWAPKIAAADVTPLGLGKGASWAAWWFYNFLWGRGGQYSDEWTVTLDTPEAIDAAKQLQAMLFEKKTAVIAASDNVADFGAGLTGCTIGSTGSLKGLLEAAKFDVGTGFLPKGPKGSACPTGGTGLAIPADRTPEQQLAAAMFLKFITNSENTAYFSSNTGYMPVRTSARDGETMAEVYKERPQFRTAVDQLETTRVQDWARVFVPGGDKELTTALEKIMLQKADPAKAFEAATTSIEKSYKQNVEPYL